ncbi:MAG: TonB family protein [Chitinophagaceae bacterium]
MEQLEFVRIGDINQRGVADDNIDNAPVADNHRDIISAPKKDPDNNEKIWIGVEIESSYPGGTTAWMRYLNKTFRYPDEAQEINVQGAVVVQFVVDVEGIVSDVEAISGPVNGGLRDETVRVIRKSGKWEPAIQNGRKAKSYKKQPITFKLDTE